MTDLGRIVFAVPDTPARAELWTRGVADRARAMGFHIVLLPSPAPTDAAGWAVAIADARALVTSWGSPRLDADVLRRNRSLRIVGHAAGSVARIVSPELYRRGVRVVTANRVMAASVAEWCHMMTLIAARRLFDYAAAGPGVPDASRRQRARGLQDLTVGIWGWGDVARAVVPLLRAGRAGRILVSDPYLDPRDAADSGVLSVPFDELLGQSDILHTLTGLNPDTVGRLDRDALSLVPDGAVIINAGRAPLIARDAFLEVLSSGRISAILDVHYREPVRADDPFTELPNVFLTPHCAGYPGRDRYVPLILEEFRRFLDGDPLGHEISAERAAHMTDESLRGS